MSYGLESWMDASEQRAMRLRRRLLRCACKQKKEENARNWTKPVENLGCLR